MNLVIVISFLVVFNHVSCYPWPDLTYGNITVNFSKSLRRWDGFGVTYVETAQTRNYSNWSQDYGGFSIMKQQDIDTIMKMTFDKENGLRPGLIKMFLDTFHEGLTIDNNDNNDPFLINMSGFDHETTTKSMRYHATTGYKTLQSFGADLSIITTLYGPAPWQTWQKFITGRDIDPSLKYEVGEYMVSWAKYLIDVEKLPVKYISFHNEGENYQRWSADGASPLPLKNDYDMWWTPEQVHDFMNWMPNMLNKQDVTGVGLTPGETGNWYNFYHYGFSGKLAEDPMVIKNIGGITSHGFHNCEQGSWRSNGIDEIRSSYSKSNPNGEELHAFVMSDSWSDMTLNSFALSILQSVTIEKLNGYIPWAYIQRPDQWVGGDPNPGTAFIVNDDGSYNITKGYYYFKQFSRAGQSNMNVVETSSDQNSIFVLGFNKGINKVDDVFDNFIILSLNNGYEMRINIHGSNVNSYAMYRTSDGDSGDNFKYIGTMNVTKIDNDNSYFMYKTLEGVVSFFGVN